MKERLVGALVLVGVAVVVLPWILDNEKEAQSFESQIPEAPPSEPTRIIELTQPRPLDERINKDQVIAAETRSAPVRPDEEDAQESPASMAAAEAPVPALSASGDVTSDKPTATGFVVQLGSFANQDNAERLVHELRSKGLKAYSRSEKNGDTAVVRVLIGPVLQRAEAEQLQQKARQVSKQSGIIVSFDPLKH